MVTLQEDLRQRSRGSRGSRDSRRIFVVIAALSCVAAAATSAVHGAAGRFCSDTANLQFKACTSEVVDDNFNARAICTNVEDMDGRQECFADAEADRRDARGECSEQRAARLDLCGDLGEARYDPDFDPADFDADFAHPTHPNSHFPLGIGNRWEYRGGDETIVVEVLDATKNIEGVTCVVVNDRVETNGVVVEDTDDWFGLRTDGTVFYCGEISKNYELFDGDDPAEPELGDVEGSWKAGRDGAQPGTLFQGAPVVGSVYRQEFAAGDAEDAAEVLSTTYRFGSDAALDAFVPPALAALLCAAGDCVVTGEFSPLSPGGFEHKYYARGVGLFLEVHPDSGEIAQLVQCNFDSRCNSLPAP